MKCLACKKNQLSKFLDFKSIPLVNGFSSSLKKSNKTFKLQVMICKSCFVCQLKDTPSEKKIFEKYSHFSSGSKDNINHLKQLSKLIKKKYGNKKNILEVGCNDGTLLNDLNKNFNVIGVDPAKNFRFIHKKRKLKVIYDHFGKNFLNKKNEEYFDIIIGINVFAHFKKVSESFKTINKLLNDEGRFLFEVAYAVPTLFSGNFDTVYHEHVFNHTITGLKSMLSNAGFEIESVKLINTQGGSIRVIAKKNKNKTKLRKTIGLLLKEKKRGLNKYYFYKKFSEKLNNKIDKIKSSIHFLISKTEKKCLLVGAPARGVIFANVCNLKSYSKLLNCVDDTKAKNGKFFPGLNIKVNNWDYVKKHVSSYDTAILLSWNYKKTMINKLKKVKFKGRMLTLFPSLHYNLFK